LETLNCFTYLQFCIVWAIYIYGELRLRKITFIYKIVLLPSILWYQFNQLSLWPSLRNVSIHFVFGWNRVQKIWPFQLWKALKQSYLSFSLFSQKLRLQSWNDTLQKSKWKSWVNNLDNRTHHLTTLDEKCYECFMMNFKANWTFENQN